MPEQKLIPLPLYRLPGTSALLEAECIAYPELCDTPRNVKLSVHLGSKSREGRELGTLDLDSPVVIRLPSKWQPGSEDEWTPTTPMEGGHYWHLYKGSALIYLIAMVEGVPYIWAGHRKIRADTMPGMWSEKLEPPKIGASNARTEESE